MFSSDTQSELCQSDACVLCSQTCVDKIDKSLGKQPSPSTVHVLSLVVGLATVGIAAYFLHYLYQVKRECPEINKTARRLAEVLLWVQIVLLLLGMGWDAYKLFA